MRPDDPILAATLNPGKLEEMRRLLADLPLRVLGLDSLTGYQPPEETASSYLGNAFIKARHAALHSGLVCFADDSGLEVDALDGAPGLYSARFDGPSGTPESRNAKLLTLLESVPREKRTARFRAEVALVRPSGTAGCTFHEESFSGVLEGRVATEPTGSAGFGYDPVFWIPSENCTVACLSPLLKDRLSHRGQAMRKLARRLSQLLQPADGS